MYRYLCSVTAALHPIRSSAQQRLLTHKRALRTTSCSQDPKWRLPNVNAKLRDIDLPVQASPEHQVPQNEGGE